MPVKTVRRAGRKLCTDENQAVTLGAVGTGVPMMRTTGRNLFQLRLRVSEKMPRDLREIGHGLLSTKVGDEVEAEMSACRTVALFNCRVMPDGMNCLRCPVVFNCADDGDDRTSRNDGYQG
jgi:hypothetical protein